MTTMPVLGLTELASGQAIPETTVNELGRYLEQGARWFGRVKDRDLTAPPGSPADGDCYIVDASATGDWSGHDGDLAFYMSTAWEFITPLEGDGAYIADEDVAAVYDGAAWNALATSAVPTEATASEIWTGSATTKYVSPDKLFDAAAPTTLASSTNATAVDMATGINFNLPLDEDSEISNPTNAKAGQSGRIRVTDDGTGGWDLNFAANWKFLDTDPTPITTVASEVHLFAYFVNSSTDIELSYLGTLT